MASESDISALPRFDVYGDPSRLSAKWRRWHRAFELYAVGKNIKDNDRKRALLLHMAGMDVQDIFFTLPEGRGDNVYAKAVSSLEQYFAPQSNVPFERHSFRSITQEANETIAQYIVRLRQKAETCEFHNVDAEIRDQIIEKCRSNELRRKLLEKGRTLTLEELRGIARALEDATTQAKSIEGIVESVNKLSFKKKSNFVRDVECYKCGRKGHIAKDRNCPAKDKQCRRCGKQCHFEKKCKSSQPTKQNRSMSRGATKFNRVRNINSDSEPASDTAMPFNIHETYPTATSILVNIEGIQTKFIIDSGSSCNIIDRATWEYLKNRGIKCKNEPRKKEIFAYNSIEPLPVAGMFWASVQYRNIALDDTEFIVIEGKGQSLLGCDTAIRLGVLKIVHNVDECVSSGSNVFKEHSDLFKGLGKLKNYQLEIPVDNSVQPVVQQTRRVPYQLRDKLRDKLTELQDLDIIEPVEGPSKWVSPVVIVPKANGDIRLCVDMRQANAAVNRVRYPIPTVDEVLQEMNNSKTFSKIDINNAYHQIELSPESREITTFTTHMGLFRYKRLMFGISCAPEMYQMILKQTLQHCEGVQNIMDDIIVHGPNQKVHDERLC